MTLTVQQGMRWIGFSLEDYQRMFDLSADELKKNLLDYMSGASSFTAQMRLLGHTVIAYDNAYRLSSSDIRSRIQTMLGSAELFLKQFPERVHWQARTIEQWLLKKQGIVAAFLTDFEAHLASNSYVIEPDPQMHFDLVLCSHYFFNQPNLSLDNCAQTLQGLCRLANEVRIFPLLNDQGEQSPLLGPLLIFLQTQQYGVEIREVDFEFQKGGNAMLRVWAQACARV